MSVDIKADGKVSYKDASMLHVPMAKALLSIEGVPGPFFDNVLTVTQNGTLDWPPLDEIVQDTIHDHINDHDANFVDLVATRLREERHSAPRS